MPNLLNIVSEEDEIIGQASREEIHRQGWRHREVHVYFLTPDRQMIFQHRARDKDLYPDLLDATVGGHVEIGESYEEAAVKETWEETGWEIKITDLIPLGKTKGTFQDQATGKINSIYLNRFLYIYTGLLSDLRLEPGKAIGFETRPIDSLAALDDNERALFIPYILDFATRDLIKFLSAQGILQ